jgi:predicted metalloendopeptidase
MRVYIFRRILANFVVLRVVDFVAAQSRSSELGAIYVRFQKEIDGRQDREQGWKVCVDVLSRNLPFAIGAIYIENYFKADAKASIEEMYSNIKGEFTTLITNAEWIDESTRDKLLNKLQTLVPLIAFPGVGFDEQAIKSFYDEIKIDKDQYLRTLFQLRVIDADNKFRQSYTSTSNEWQNYLAPTSIAAHYSASDNTIRKIE